MEQRISENPGAERLHVELTNRETPVELKVTIASPSPASTELARDLATIASKHYRTAVNLLVVTELISRSDSGGASS